MGTRDDGMKTPDHGMTNPDHGMKATDRATLDVFLDSVAARTPTPGGGGVAAAAGALACAMARMVAGYSIGRKTDDATRGRVEEVTAVLRRCDDMLRELIAADAAAYAHMTGTKKRAEHDDTRAAAHQRAVVTAVSVPMQIAAVASNAVAAMDDLKDVASRYLISDLGVAAVLAAAAAQAARYSVRVNLPELHDDRDRAKLRDDTDRIVQHCQDHRASVQDFIDDHMP